MVTYSISLKQIQRYCASIILILCAIAWYQRDFILHSLNAYALKSTEQKFGAQLIAPEQEEKIKMIAQEMGVIENFVIRKMNYNALQTFGYHNAFAYFPALLNFIPISNQPFLYMSEGFFEDLSEAEQRFLIGHELIHIKEHHLQYAIFLLYLLELVLVIALVLSKKHIFSFAQKYGPVGYQRSISYVILSLLLGMCLVIPDLIGFAYRKHVEWEADHESMQLLKTYDGGITLIQRWEREFKFPWHNPYWGLFSDHPSNFDRKKYCLELKNKWEEKT